MARLVPRLRVMNFWGDAVNVTPENKLPGVRRQGVRESKQESDR